MTTIVSAFLNNVNLRDDRNIEKYITLGGLLLRANIPKIIFVDNETYEKIQLYENENTKIIKIDKTDGYLYNYIDLLTNFNLHSTCPSKDTLEFIFTMCNKTEWMRDAIKLNVFDTDNFIWVDFGIRHVFKCSDNDFIQKIESLNTKIYDSVRIGTIWDLNYLYNIDIYKDISWYFAGGVFGGDKESLLEFADKTKEQCLRTIKEKNTLMWEVNIWYMVFNNIMNNNTSNNPLFNLYKCDHNDSIIDNY